MKKTLKQVLSVLLVGIMSVSMLAACAGGGSGDGGENSGGGSGGDRKFFTFAAPPASSALYPYWVSVGKAISTAEPQYNITVSESQGAVDIAKRVRTGEVLVGNSVASTDYEGYNGIGTFEGEPFPDLRILWYYEITCNQFVVSQASGITTASDLEGQKFNPGGTGTSAAAITFDMMRQLGVSPDYFEAGQADAADAYADRQIVGTVKLGPVGDSYIMQLAVAQPITMISFTETEMAEILEAFPYLVEVVIPAGTYDGVDYDVVTVGCPQGAQTTSELSQEDGYLMLKAMCEGGKSVWQAAYPAGADNDILQMTLNSSIPLHAGAVQYLKEQGYDVPEHLIPSEYQEV